MTHSDRETKQPSKQREPTCSEASRKQNGYMHKKSIITSQTAETHGVCGKLFRPSQTTSPCHRPVMMTHPSQMHSMGLIYQSNVETSADPSAQINLRQSSRVIYETFVCRQSHRTKDRTLINVAAENNRHLNITPLKTPRFRSHAPKVYDTEKHNPAKKRKDLIKEKLILLQKHPLTL